MGSKNELSHHIHMPFHHGWTLNHACPLLVKQLIKVINKYVKIISWNKFLIL